MWIFVTARLTPVLLDTRKDGANPGVAGPRLLLTKPGAFGNPSTVADLAARLLG
jgi:hypothetical protein